jgi:hypothetical protein
MVLEMMLCLVVVVQGVVDDAFEGQMHDEQVHCTIATHKKNTVPAEAQGTGFTIAPPPPRGLTTYEGK